MKCHESPNRSVRTEFKIVLLKTVLANAVLYVLLIGFIITRG